MELKFDRQVVIVTGASSGIGQAAARAFGASGAKTVVHCHRHRAAAEATAQKIQAEGGAALVCRPI
jgi:glucose 1-dehydrogenase